MNELAIFENNEFGPIRTTVIDGEPWLVGKDVALSLGYRDTDQAIRDHVDAEDKLTRSFDGSGQGRSMTVINESGLYSLIFSSKMQAAKEFKRWVTSEVLPSIRKTGSYSTSGISREKYFQAAELIAGTDSGNLPYVIEALRLAGIDLGAAGRGRRTPSHEGEACVEAFLDDVLPRAKWDLLPFQTLYEMYAGWTGRNRPGTVPCDKRRFMLRLADLMPKDGWDMPGVGPDGKYRKVRTGDRMDADEPLLRECGNVALPKPAVNHRGIVRIGSMLAGLKGRAAVK